MHLVMGQKAFTVFKSYMGLLKVINEELTLKVDETGIEVMGMDPSHVAMVDSKVKPDLFEEFTPPKGDGNITINLSEFSKFLDRIEKETVNIDYDPEQAKLNIVASTGGRTRRFSLPILEPLEEDVPKPKIFFKSSVRLLTSSVERAIKDAGLVSEHIKIEIDGEVAKFDGKGDIGSATNEYTKDSEEVLEIKSEEKSEANFTLSYLTDMFGQIRKLADVVTLELSTDMPLKIEIEPSNPNLEITFYLAPMIGV